MMPRYSYRLEGTGRHGHTWLTTGIVETAQSGEFPSVPLAALRDGFEKLTDGRAEYGDLATCQGPFTITRLAIELVDVN